MREFDYADGLVSAGASLALSAAQPDGLAVDNTGGQFFAGGNLDLVAISLTSGGNLLVNGDLS